MQAKYLWWLLAAAIIIAAYFGIREVYTRKLENELGCQ